jgi:succinate dehydrogenase / fumarate reductase cytochrome b subunit
LTKTYVYGKFPELIHREKIPDEFIRLVHLTVNSLILFDSSGDLFNRAAHFMATNPVIKIIEPVLAIGFVLHIIYAGWLTLQNQLTRPVKYEQKHSSNSSTWASRNMFVLGALVLIFLIIHVSNFFWKIRYTGSELLENPGADIENTYKLVTTYFIDWWWIVIVYVVGAVILGLHLMHAFWSAFQTLGWSNSRWRKRLDIIGWVYTIIVAGGFALIPLWVKISSML